MFDSHRGARPSGPFNRAADRRVAELDNAVRIFEAQRATTSPGGPAADPLRAGQLIRQAPVITVGSVVHSIPQLDWYAVQTREFGRLPARAVTGHSTLPIGVRTSSTYQPGSFVLLVVFPNYKHAMVLGALPNSLIDGLAQNPDCVQAGGGSGADRERIQRFPVTGTYGQGGTQAFGPGRAYDLTSLDAGCMAETGVGLFVDPFQAVLRVNEVCGVFLNLFDSYAKLTGRQLDIRSAAHELRVRDDESEATYRLGIATYPWETLGLYAPGTRFNAEVDDKVVQYEGHLGKVDLPDGQLDVQPFHRWQEYGGYLGQGHLRMLVRPAKETGVRKEGDGDRDECLFREAVGIDGGLSLFSAKSVHIGRRVKMAAPREIRRPEDGQGDDATAGNYKFSGLNGNGSPHKLAEVQVTGEHKGLRRAAAVLDLVSAVCNWKSLHPFHYHANDYDTPQESETSVFSKTQSTIDYDQLKTSDLLDDPEPVVLRIDHRYTDAEYYERESGICFTDDGGVVIYDGSGASITLSSGKLRIDTPGDLELCAGRTLAALAGQIVARGQGSIDLSSGKDLRLKAENNLQVLAGNSGQGGLLLEARSDNKDQAYTGKIGEDVASSGIVLKAADSQVVGLASEIYFRTGGDGLGSGNIVLDAGQGNSQVLVTSRDFNLYLTGAMTLWFGPSEQTEEATAVCRISESFTNFETTMAVGGQIITYGDSANIIVDGSITATGSIATAGSLASRSGGPASKVPDGFADAITQSTAPVTEMLDALREQGETSFTELIREPLYGDDKIGAAVGNIAFSFRDDASQAQYRTAGLHWLESRWMQFVRTGMATGGSSWEEKPVSYQGQDLYPWPGRKAWLEDNGVFLRLQSMTLYDPAAGCARDRPGPYESPRLGDWDTVTMAEGLKTNFGD